MVRITLRLPDDLHEKLLSSSLAKNNSINSEIIKSLYLSLGVDDRFSSTLESNEKTINILLEDIQNKLFLLSKLVNKNR